MKKTCSKILFCFLSSFLLLSLTFQIFGQRKPKNKIPSNNPTTYRYKNSDERRKIVENLLLKGEYEHDGSGELMYIGTIDSVPALMQVLKNHPPHIVIVDKEAPPFIRQKDDQLTYPSKPKENKIYICTYAHAVFALHKITGQKFIDYEDWKTWWENYQKENSVKKN